MDFTFTRAPTDSTAVPITVNFTVGGSATFGSDYTVSGADTFTTTNGSATIPIGQTSKTINITPTPDAIVENDETIIITLIPNLGFYAVGGAATVTGTILNDDGAGAGGTIRLYLAYEGANNSTTFADSSPSNHTVTAFGDAKISTTSPIEGTSSGSFDGSGDYLRVTASSDFDFGSIDFSISTKVKTTQSGVYKALISKRVSGFTSGCWALYVNNGIVEWWCADFSNLAPMLVGTGSNVSNGSTHTIKVQRSGNNWELRVDGTVVATVTSSVAIAANNIDLAIATDLSSANIYDYAGSLDETIIQKS